MCILEFKKWSELVAHRKDLHRPKCTICEKEFATRANCKLHMAMHKDLGNRTVYLCTYTECPRFYFYPRNLEQHIQSKHLNGQRFECDICAAKLVTKQKLKLHLNWHCRQTAASISGKHALPAKRKPVGKRKDAGTKKITMAEHLAGVRLTPVRSSTNIEKIAN